MVQMLPARMLPNPTLPARTLPAIALSGAPWLGEAEAHLPEGSLRRIAAASLLTLVIGFGGLVAWAALTTIESAVPAAGVIVSGGKRKTISLPENGILRQLLVHEGDEVAAGQVLAKLDEVQARATQKQASTLYWSAVARAARLSAEAADERTMTVPDALRAAAAQDPDVAAALAAETYQFRTRWGALDASVRVQDRKIAQHQTQITAVRAQIAAHGTRLSLIEEELRGTDYLLARGLATKPRMLELRRTEADLRGQIGALAGQMAGEQQAIAQVELETINAAEARRSDVSRERAETQAARAEAGQRLAAADDLLSKREILAPEAGTVTDIKFFTPGSSIMAGQPVMDLVPASAALLIEGRVTPNEVEHLAVGQRVNVRLTAYKSHRVPVLTGRLTYVGADRQTDPSNQPFFLVRAELDPGALRDKPGVVLLPGMSADVLIVNGARTTLDFLISPITDSIHRAMKEE